MTVISESPSWNCLFDMVRTASLERIATPPTIHIASKSNSWDTAVIAIIKLDPSYWPPYYWNCIFIDISHFSELVLSNQSISLSTQSSWLQQLKRQICNEVSGGVAIRLHSIFNARQSSVHGTQSASSNGQGSNTLRCFGHLHMRCCVICAELSFKSLNTSSHDWFSQRVQTTHT